MMACSDREMNELNIQSGSVMDRLGLASVIVTSSLVRVLSGSLFFIYQRVAP
ncbi:hypothetical protein D3C85_1848540 [compost metagenome]